MEVSEGISKNIVALPMHPYLNRDVQDYIIEMVIEFYNQ